MACDRVHMLGIVDLMRKVPAAAVAFVVVLTAACSSTPQIEAGQSGSLAAPIRATNTPPSRPLPNEATLACGDYIDTAAAPPEDWQVVLGVVALPSSPRSAALQTSLTGETGSHRLFAKTGLLIKPGATFDLVVPDEFTKRLGIGWANGPAIPASSLAVMSCPNPKGSGWLAYPGGYWIDRPTCVPLIVKASGKEQRVHIGLGTACPGQAAPEGPNAT